MNIHIVEDDEAVADALSIVLGELDYHPTIYSDGETFLAEAAVTPADVVILDLGLPGISGADVAHELKARSAPPRIVAITGKSQMRLNRDVQDLPDLKVLRKPLSMDKLVEAVA